MDGWGEEEVGRMGLDILHGTILDVVDYEMPG